MRCPNCGSEVNERWRFCPVCGSRLERDTFSDIFERMGRELKEMDKIFERNFEVFDLSPFFRKPLRGSGFTIRITRKGNERPKVPIKTFGNVNENELKSEMEKLGLREIPQEDRGRVSIEKAKVTEEPETSVVNVGDRIVVEVKLPGVKDQKDIEIRSLENSVEVRAIAGDKAYFKILTKPPKANIVKREFRDGVLRIELV